MKKMFWMAAILAVVLAPVLVNAADWKANRAALIKEAAELRRAVAIAKMKARKTNEAVKAMDKDIRAARKAVKEIALKDEKIVALRKTATELARKRTELQKGIEAAKPFHEKLAALESPGKDATVEAKAAVSREYKKIYREMRKVYAADKAWADLRKQMADARKAVREAMAANEDVKAAQAKADALRKKQNDLLAEDPAVKEAQTKADAKMKELKDLKRPKRVRKKKAPAKKTEKPVKEG